MRNLAEVLKGDCRIPLPPLPLLTKEGSEKPQKLPTRFGEEPSFLLKLMNRDEEAKKLDARRKTILTK